MESKPHYLYVMYAMCFCTIVLETSKIKSKMVSERAGLLFSLDLVIVYIFIALRFTYILCSPFVPASEVHL